MARKLPVRIINPAPHSSAYTSYKRALRFVHAGLAAWEVSGMSIRIHQSAEAIAHLHFDATRRGYDEIHRVMTLDEIAGLPCCRPEMALWGRDQRAT